MQKNIIGVDLGATSGRVILARAGDDRLRMEELHRFPNRMREIDGRFYWDIHALYEEILRGLSVAGGRGERIDSIGIDTWGVDFACVDPDGDLLGLPRAYRDPYTDGVPEEFFRTVPRESVYAKTGIQVMNFNSLYQLYALNREHSPALAAAEHVLFMPDALSYLLTGEQVCEYTILSTSQLMNPRTRELDGELWFWKGVQFLFFRQWEALKARAAEQGGAIIGDLPIYVAEDSADVWADPSQFQMDEALRPTGVAGCPPDGFSADGQRWGNPLFDWEAMKADGYRWWLRRISFQFRFYDVLRIDHFRGFEAYYAIPAGAENAKKGFWKPGPGLDFFRALETAIGKRPIIAEDLGFLTPAVHQLLADTGFPGMKVLQFAFDSRDGGGRAYQPHNYPANCVAYVGTHDNDTALGWLAEAEPADVALAREYLHLDPAEGENWGMMRAVWASTADCAVVQMQDVLGLGGDARMNTPGTVGDHNWSWRVRMDAFNPYVSGKLREITRTYRRCL